MRSGPATAGARRRWTLVAATLGLSITILDETVVFLALPAIDRELGVGLNGQQWVVNGYLLPLSALLLVAGSLADRYGRRRLFVLGLVGFGAASLAAGLAPSTEVLIAARVVQGVFAALVMPSTLALLIATFQGEERGRAIGAWAAWSGVAAVVGPLAAGLLISAGSWRLVFLLSLPAVAVAVALAYWAVEESREDRSQRDRLDLVGALLATATVGGAAYAVVQGPESGWADTGVLTGALLSPLALAAFVAWERRNPSPMLPLRLFRSRDFRAANAATLALYAVFNGNFFLLTIYLQTALGYSALAAGAATLPVTLLMLALSERAGRLGERIGPRRPVIAGQALVVAGLVLLSFLEPGDGYLEKVAPGVVVFGAGLALTVAPLTNTALSAAPDAWSGLASGVNNAAARLAGLLGVALIGLTFGTVFHDALAEGERTGVPGSSLEEARQRPTAALQMDLAPAARPHVREATVDAYRTAMWTGAAVGALGALVALGIHRSPRSSTGDPDGGPTSPDGAG